MRLKKRILLSCFLGLSLLLSCAAAETVSPSLDEQASAWCIIDQHNPRYVKPEYNYDCVALAYEGCGPCSNTNALIAHFNITDWNTSDTLLQEMLYFLTEDHRPSNGMVVLQNFTELMDPDPVAYPLTSSLMNNFNAVEILSARGKYDNFVEMVDRHLDEEGPVLLGARRSDEFVWKDVMNLLLYLHETGHDDALLTISHVSAGKQYNGGTFGMGTSGHYVTFLFQAGQYFENGTFYVLDSLPRAVSMKEVEEEGWPYIYPYVTRDDDMMFINFYDTVHLQDTVVRAVPKPAQWEEVLEGEPRARRSLLERVVVHSSGMLLLSWQ